MGASLRIDSLSLGPTRCFLMGHSWDKALNNGRYRHRPGALKS